LHGAARQWRTDPDAGPGARSAGHAQGVRRSEGARPTLGRSFARDARSRAEPRRVCSAQLRISGDPAAGRKAASAAPRSAVRGSNQGSSRDAGRRVGPDAVAGTFETGRPAGENRARSRCNDHCVDGGQSAGHGTLGALGRRWHLLQPPRAGPPYRRRFPRGMSTRVAVIGAGTMGHGIAYVAALAGCDVRLSDVRPEVLPQALDKVEALLVSGVKRGKLAADEHAAVRKRVRTEPQIRAAVSDADIVIEAVVEDLAIKQRLFVDVERAAPQDALLASNTSSLSIADISSVMSQPARLVGMHFFNPVHIMKLVEVVTHGSGSRPAADRAVEFARQLGKDPIVVRDSPGFASSRLGVVLGLEAMRMLEQGVATAEDIDKAMELGYNHPMGPLKLTDLVGLDVRLAIAEYLYRSLEE